MNEKKLIELTNMYFDGELDKEEEAFLFTGLAGSAEGRNYFKQLNAIRSAAGESAEEFPQELDERILKAVGRHSVKGTGLFVPDRIWKMLPYAFLLILLLLNLYLISGQINYYKNEVEDLSRQVKLQNETIQTLYNSLPGIEVGAASENEITIKPGI